MSNYPTQPLKLIIAGAGPGDPELLTVKAIEALGEANAIIYDPFVNPEILKFANVAARKVFTSQSHYSDVSETAALKAWIADLVFTHGYLVFLVNGDPFVAENVTEIISYAESLGIQVETIPGLSNLNIQTSLQQIPLLQHDDSSVFILKPSSEVAKRKEQFLKAIATGDTVVILGGVNYLEELSQIFSINDAGNIPAIIIQNGSLPNEQLVAGPVEKLATLARENNIKPPAVIIIGESVKKHPEYDLLIDQEIVLANHTPTRASRTLLTEFNI